MAYKYKVHVCLYWMNAIGIWRNVRTPTRFTVLQNNPFKICGDGYDVSSVLSINMKLNALCVIHLFS